MMASLDTDFTVHVTVTSNLIDMGKKYQTRDGRAVRLLCMDAKLSKPIVGLVTYGDGTEGVCSWTMNGYYYPADQGQHLQNSDLDLIPVPTKHEGWVVFFAGIGNDVFGTEQAALNWLRNDTRVGRVAHVTWED